MNGSAPWEMEPLSSTDIAPALHNATTSQLEKGHVAEHGPRPGRKPEGKPVRHPPLTDGETEAWVGKGSHLIYHPRTCSAASVARRPRNSVNREQKSASKTQRPSPKRPPTQVWHRERPSQASQNSLSGSGVLSAVKCSCFWQPEAYNRYHAGASDKSSGAVSACSQGAAFNCQEEKKQRPHAFSFLSK